MILLWVKLPTRRIGAKHEAKPALEVCHLADVGQCTDTISGRQDGMTGNRLTKNLKARIGQLRSLKEVESRCAKAWRDFTPGARDTRAKPVWSQRTN
jgi:hypothetical protein